jgi:nitrogen fixation protein FixH
MTQTATIKPLTGRKVALMFGGAFATIVAANLALVYSAVGSFPGLETRKPYNESLSFSTRRAGQERLGWASDVTYQNGQVALTLTEPAGGSVVTPNLKMIMGRATSSAYDQDLVVEFDGRSYIANIEIPAGNWQIKVKTTALDGTPFQRTMPLIVSDPS